METKSKRERVVVSAVAFVGLLGVLTLAIAGSLEPNSPPAPTMKTLDEIYNAVIAGSSGISGREGFSKLFNVTAGTYPILTVSSEKTFVLMQISANTNNFNIKADSVIEIMSDTITNYTSGNVFNDFPDRCVIFEQGQVLELEALGNCRVQIVGYFYDVE
jgi:hypothetical protein